MERVSITIDGLDKQVVNGQYGEQTLLKIEAGGERYSSYQGKWNSTWTAGQTVEAMLQVNGNFKNLKCPEELKPKPRNGGGFSAPQAASPAIDGRLGGIETQLSSIQEKLDRLLGNQNDQDIPF